MTWRKMAWDKFLQKLQSNQLWAAPIHEVLWNMKTCMSPWESFQMDKTSEGKVTGRGVKAKYTHVHINIVP